VSIVGGVRVILISPWARAEVGRRVIIREDSRMEVRIFLNMGF